MSAGRDDYGPRCELAARYRDRAPT